MNRIEQLQEAFPELSDAQCRGLLGFYYLAEHSVGHEPDMEGYTDFLCRQSIDVIGNLLNIVDNMEVPNK